MTMQINIKDQFKAFVNSLPNNAIQVDNIDDNSISSDQPKEKVAKS